MYSSGGKANIEYRYIFSIVVMYDVDNYVLAIIVVYISLTISPSDPSDPSDPLEASDSDSAS